MCPMALNPASLLGGLWCHHRMPCSFLWTMGLRYIRKGLASLPMQLGPCVFMARTHVPYAPDARAIMGLQDMWTGDVIITCKTCGQGSNNVATVPRRPCWPLMGHYYSARRPDRAVPYCGSCVAWQNDKTGCTPCR
jgi:hypothetical protein